ncbi:MAG: phosphotransferase, partial [Chloroflexota bacterium]|nr:phosphotransferase [Chloroflexota bacterium]
RDWEDFVVHRRESALTEFVNGGLLTARVAEELTNLLDEATDASGRSQCVVVHGDLGGSGNFLLGGTDGEWRIDYLIDFGDARIGVRDYEWMPLWLGFFDRNAETMRAFIEAYDPSLLSDGDLPRRVMAWTFLHAYSEMPVAELLQRTDTPMPVQTLEELHRVLWPNLESLVS